MNKLKNRIMKINFGKVAKWFIVISFVIVLAGSVTLGLAFRTQIGEVISYHQNHEDGAIDEVQNENESEAQNENDAQNTDALENDENEAENEHEHDHEDFLESAQFTEPSTGAKIILDVVGVLGFLIGIIYWFLIASWLYQAAEKSMMNGHIWAILGIFFNLAAVIAFLIARSFKALCPACGRRQNAGEYCRFCGTAMNRKCSSCGGVLNSRDVYCPNCGKGINKD